MSEGKKPKNHSRWAPPEDKILNGTANKTVVKNANKTTVNNVSKGKGTAPVLGVAKAKQMLRALAIQKKFAQASSVTPTAKKVPEKEAKPMEKAENPQKRKLNQPNRQFELITEIEMMKSSDALARRMLFYNIPLWLLEPSLLSRLRQLDTQTEKLLYRNMKDTNVKTDSGAAVMPTDRMPKLKKLLGEEDVIKLLKKAEDYEQRGILIKYRLIKETCEPFTNEVELIAIRADNGEPLERSMHEKREIEKMRKIEEEYRSKLKKREAEEKQLRLEAPKTPASRKSTNSVEQLGLEAPKTPESRKSTNRITVEQLELEAPKTPESRKSTNRITVESEQKYDNAKKKRASMGHEVEKEDSEQEEMIKRWKRHKSVFGRPRSRSRSTSKGPSRTAERESEEKQFQMQCKLLTDKHEDHPPVEDHSPVHDHLPVANGYSDVKQPSLEDHPEQWNEQYSNNGYLPSNDTPATSEESTSYNFQSYWAQGHGRNPYSQPSAAPSTAPTAARLFLNPFPDRLKTSSAPLEVPKEPDLSSEYEKFLDEVTNPDASQEEVHYYHHIDSFDWSGGVSRYSKESNLTQIKTVDDHSQWR